MKTLWVTNKSGDAGAKSQQKSNVNPSRGERSETMEEKTKVKKSMRRATGKLIFRIARRLFHRNLISIELWSSIFDKYYKFFEPGESW